MDFAPFRFSLQKNQSYASSFLLYRKRSHSRRLFGCKRPHNAFGSLPTFCELCLRQEYLYGSAFSSRSKLYIACSDFFVKIRVRSCRCSSFFPKRQSLFDVMRYFYFIRFAVIHGISHLFGRQCLRHMQPAYAIYRITNRPTHQRRPVCCVSGLCSSRLPNQKNGF